MKKVFNFEYILYLLLLYIKEIIMKNYNKNTLNIIFWKMNKDKILIKYIFYIDKL